MLCLLFHPRLEWKVVKILVFSTADCADFTFRSLKKAYNEE
jgi:hypothetical protein